ncbi:MAG: M28 family peptidase [Bacteroidota bacterium]
MKFRSAFLLGILGLFVPLAAQFNTTPEQLKEHVYILASDSLLGRGFGTPQGLQVAKYIAEQFEQAGIEPVGTSYLHPFNYRKGILNIPGNNVVGVIRGTDPELQDEYILLGAHYDHLGWKIVSGDTIVYNGADDNATGSSSIIEIGRNLVAGKASLGRSVILVAFDGEESGLIGSKQFLKDSIVPQHQVKVMFSIDMVGMVEAHEGVDLKGIEKLDSHQYMATELAERYDLKITKEGTQTEQRTDTAPFGKSGIPAIAVFTGTESPYHKPEDTAEKLDYDGMAQVANFMTDATLFLSNEAIISSVAGEAEEGKSVASSGKSFRFGVRLNTGSSQHNYVDRFYKGKRIFATGAGVMMNIKAAGFLNIQPELLYETKGSQHQDGVFRTHSLTTPLNLLIISPEDEMVRTFAQIGGYYSYHFGGQAGGTDIDFTNEYNNQEFGITFGFGVEMMHVQWGLYFQKGLSDLNRLSGDRIRHENIYFMLGYLF